MSDLQAKLCQAAGDGWVAVDNFDDPKWFHNERGYVLSKPRKVELICDKEGVVVYLTEGRDSTSMNLTFADAKFLFGRVLEFVEEEEKKI